MAAGTPAPNLHRPTLNAAGDGPHEVLKIGTCLSIVRRFFKGLFHHVPAIFPSKHHCSCWFNPPWKILLISRNRPRYGCETSVFHSRTNFIGGKAWQSVRMVEEVKIRLRCIQIKHLALWKPKFDLFIYTQFISVHNLLTLQYCSKMLNVQFEKERIEREGMAENCGDHLLQNHQPICGLKSIQPQDPNTKAGHGQVCIWICSSEKATCGFVMQTADFLGKTYCCIQ